MADPGRRTDLPGEEGGKENGRASRWLPAVAGTVCRLPGSGAGRQALLGGGGPVHSIGEQILRPSEAVSLARFRFLQGANPLCRRRCKRCHGNEMGALPKGGGFCRGG